MYCWAIMLYLVCHKLHEFPPTVCVWTKHKYYTIYAWNNLKRKFGSDMLSNIQHHVATLSVFYFHSSTIIRISIIQFCALFSSILYSISDILLQVNLNYAFSTYLCGRIICSEIGTNALKSRTNWLPFVLYISW